MSSVSTSSSSNSTAIPMKSAQIVAFYTADLVLGRNPAKALQHLFNVGTSMKPFVDAGTEQLLSKYDDDYSCRVQLQMLREKFDTLRRREARIKRSEPSKFDEKKIIEKKKEEGLMSQEDTNNLFTTAVQQTATTKTVVKRVDYSKFKIVKRTKKVPKVQQTATPKIRTVNPKLRSFSFTSSVYSWSSSESAETSPEYQ